jgi:hypothetical protein
MSSIYSAAGRSLGLDAVLGGNSPTDQVNDETEEEKKRRQMGLSALQSPAGKALLSGAFAGY